MLDDFAEHLMLALSAAQQKIMHDMRDLEKLSEAIQIRTADHLEEQARKIRQAAAELEESRMEWRTVTWKTMLPPYLAGVLLTLWVLLMAVQLSFPEPQRAAPESGLTRFGLDGATSDTWSWRLGPGSELAAWRHSRKLSDPQLNGGEVCVETHATR